MQHFGLRLRVPFEHEPEHRHEHEQQRKQRHEPVVGDQRRHPARFVVAELLDHRRRERRAGGGAAAGDPARAGARRGSSCPPRSPGACSTMRGHVEAQARNWRGGKARRERHTHVSTRSSREHEPWAAPGRASGLVEDRGWIRPEEVALVAHAARRAAAVRVPRWLRWEDLEDCYSQATLELVAQARRGDLRCSSRAHLRSMLELRFVSRVAGPPPRAARAQPGAGDARRRALAGRRGRARSRDRRRARRRRAAHDAAPASCARWSGRRTR